MPPAALLPIHTKQLPRPQFATFHSVLAWPAWLRVLAVLPALVLLWLGVAWATVDVVAL